MEKCHLTIRCQSQTDDVEYMIDFSEDNNIAKPHFIRKSSIEHTIQSRWATPCRVILKSSELKMKNMKYYNAYYHPLAYQLSKNTEFKRLIIENAIESLTSKGTEIAKNNYEIVPNNENVIVKTDKPTRPRYEISVFSSNFSHQNFVQLIVWLPLIISSHSIIIETSNSSIYLQTEKPHRYEIVIPWPSAVSSPEICFCNFLMREKRLILVAECHMSLSREPAHLIPSLESEPSSPLSDSSSDKENQSPALSLPPIKDSYEWFQTDEPGHKVMTEIATPNANEMIPESLEGPPLSAVDIQSETEQASPSFAKAKKGPGKKSGNSRVRFDSFNICLEFADSTPVMEIADDKSGCHRQSRVPMKTHDGCSAKKFTYHQQHQNKSHKGNREKAKNSARCKRNNNKKRA